MIKLDPEDPSALIYKGEKVGRIESSDETATVTLDLHYECVAAAWNKPILELLHRLARIDLCAGSDGNAASLTHQVAFTGRDAIVRVQASYTSDVSDWIVPISWFAREIDKLATVRGPTVLTFTAGDDEIDWHQQSRHSLLLEKELMAGGRAWRFHKSDPDHWPSPLHGHNYECGWVINGVTGEIFDTTNRRYQGKLRRKELRRLHADIRSTVDLAHHHPLLPDC